MTQPNSSSKTLSPIAQDVAEARALGISYGMLHAIRYDAQRCSFQEEDNNTRRCPFCGKPVYDKRRKYCTPRHEYMARMHRSYDARAKAREERKHSKEAEE